MGTFRLDDEDIARIADAVAKRIAPSATDGPSPTWMNSKQAAEHLAVPVSTIQEATANRAIPFHKRGPGGRCYFRASELDRAREDGLI